MTEEEEFKKVILEKMSEEDSVVDDGHGPCYPTKEKRQPEGQRFHPSRTAEDYRVTVRRTRARGL